MVKRRNLRDRLKKNVNQKGLLPLSIYLKKLPLSSKVVIKPSPDVHDYYPPKTFHGHIGIVKERSSSNKYRIYVPSLRKTYEGIKAHLKLIK